MRLLLKAKKLKRRYHQMKIKELWDTYFITKKLQDSKKKDEMQWELNNERCENFFRCDDETNDGRGNY